MSKKRTTAHDFVHTILKFLPKVSYFVCDYILKHVDEGNTHQPIKIEPLIRYKFFLLYKMHTNIDIEQWKVPGRQEGEILPLSIIDQSLLQNKVW